MEAAFSELEAEGAAMLDRAGTPPRRREFQRTIDARYERQSYELSVPAASFFDKSALAKAAETFHDRHRQTYGHDNRGEPVQIVSLRVSAIGKIPALAIRQEPQIGAEPVKGNRAVRFKGETLQAEILDRVKMPKGHTAKGPAVIESLESTILIPQGWQAEMDSDGYIRITRASA